MSNLIELFIVTTLVLTYKISAEKHELIYNNDIVYYDECRISVSPRNYLQPVAAYVQIQKPCNGTLLWTYPNLDLTLTIVNLENEPFTICFEQKPIEQKLIRSIKVLHFETKQKVNMREESTNTGVVLCATSSENRIIAVIEAEPLYGGVYIPYAMFSKNHPWTTGPNPSWQRSDKYLYGPNESMQKKKKKMRQHRRKMQ